MQDCTGAQIEMPVCSSDGERGTHDVPALCNNLTGLTLTLDYSPEGEMCITACKEHQVLTETAFVQRQKV